MKKSSTYLLGALLLILPWNLHAGFFATWFIKRPLSVIGYIASYIIPVTKNEVKQVRTENGIFALKIAADLAADIKSRSENLVNRLDHCDNSLIQLNSSFDNYGREQKVSHAQLLRVAAENQYEAETAHREFLKKNAANDLKVADTITSLEAKQRALQSEIKRLEEDELTTENAQWKLVHGQLRAKMIESRLKKMREESEKVHKMISSLSEQLVNCHKQGEQFENRISYLQKTYDDLHQEQNQQKAHIENKTNKYFSIFAGVAALVNNEITPGMQTVKEDVKVIRDQHELIKKLVLKCAQEQKESIENNKSRHSFIEDDLIKASPAMNRVLRIKN